MNCIREDNEQLMAWIQKNMNICYILYVCFILCACCTCCTSELSLDPPGCNLAQKRLRHQPFSKYFPNAGLFCEIPVVTDLLFKLKIWLSHEQNRLVFQQDLQEAKEKRQYDAAGTGGAYTKSPYTHCGNHSRELCVRHKELA